MQVTEQILLLPLILTIMIQAIQGYEKNGFLVFKSIELHEFLIKMSKQSDP